MYYEIYDKLSQPRGVTPILLTNKILLDSIFKNRSFIDEADYNIEVDVKSFSEGGNRYLIIQNIIMGIANSLWLGLCPFKLATDTYFNKAGRISIGEGDLVFLNVGLNFFLKSNPDGVLRYDNTSFSHWETFYINSQSNLSELSGTQPTREGFRYYLFRDLELIYSMVTKKPGRNGWVRLLNDLIIEQKAISIEEVREVYKINIEVQPFEEMFNVSCSDIELHDYLETNFRTKISGLAGHRIANKIRELDFSQRPLRVFSEINKVLIGQIPLANFYLNQHMFVCKEAYTISQYLDFFVYSWTKSPDIKIWYIDNNYNKYSADFLPVFIEKLKIQKYSIVCGFSAVSDGEELFFFAKPLIVRD